MLGQSYLQLLSPLIFLVFAAGFLLLYRQARDLRALRFFALSYLLGSSAMMVDFLRNSAPPGIVPPLTSLLFLATTVSFCAGLYTLYKARVPWTGLLAGAAAVFAVFLWSRFEFDSFVIGAWIINTGVVAFYTHTQFSLRHRMRGRIDRFLQSVIVVSSALLIIRTAIVLWYEGATVSDATYAGSLAAVTLQLFIAVAALAVAGVLFAKVGLDIVRGLTERSETDPLTGVLNRRGFEARIASIVNEGPGAHTVHAVIMADIDRFKVVNDTYGHEAGDAVIEAFASLLVSAAREDDFVVRWGGEEFLVVIVNGETASARLYAETVRTRWEMLRHDCLGGRSVTASFGVAGWRNGQDLAGVSRQADAALYRAKRAGRNRVCLDGPETSGRFEIGVA